MGHNCGILGPENRKNSRWKAFFEGEAVGRGFDSRPGYHFNSLTSNKKQHKTNFSASSWIKLTLAAFRTRIRTFLEHHFGSYSICNVLFFKTGLHQPQNVWKQIPNKSTVFLFSLLWKNIPPPLPIVQISSWTLKLHKTGVESKPEQPDKNLLLKYPTPCINRMKISEVVKWDDSVSLWVCPPSLWDSAVLCEIMPAAYHLFISVILCGGIIRSK